MSKQPFNAGQFIQDVVYGATPWGIVDNALGNPLPRMHLSRVDSAAEDITATVDPNDPNNHEINPVTRMLLGLKPDMKARDLQNDRARYYNTEEGKNLKLAGDNSGYISMDENNQYRNTNSLRGDIVRAAPNIQTLKDEGVTYAQVGLKNAGTDANGNTVTPTTIAQRAQAFKNLKQVNSQLQEIGETPNKGATYPELQQQLKEAKIKNERDAIIRADETRFGVTGENGEQSGGTTAGRMERARDNEALETSRSTRKVNQGNLAINQVTARNAQTQQEYTNERNKFEYADRKVEAEIERQFLAAQQSAQYDANYKTIQLQNAAEMERYEMMLDNDREVRRGDKISDLIASLVLFGGTMG